MGKTISITLSPEQYDTLKRKAEDKDVTVQNYIRSAIMEERTIETEKDLEEKENAWKGEIREAVNKLCEVCNELSRISFISPDAIAGELEEDYYSLANLYYNFLSKLEEL